MAHSYHHAVSSARKWGGTPDDYLPIHGWMDGSKLILADFRHRALRHHAEGCFMAEQVFGVTITNAAGRIVPVAVHRRAAHHRGPRPHPVLRGLGTRDPAGTVDGPAWADPRRTSWR